MQFDVNIRLYEYWHEQVKIRKKRWNNKENGVLYPRWEKSVRPKIIFGQLSIIVDNILWHQHREPIIIATYIVNSSDKVSRIGGAYSTTPKRALITWFVTRETRRVFQDGETLQDADRIRPNNDLQNTTQKTWDGATRTH
jgi:hypothetical protein